MAPGGRSWRKGRHICSQEEGSDECLVLNWISPLSSVQDVGPVNGATQ